MRAYDSRLYFQIKYVILEMAHNYVKNSSPLNYFYFAASYQKTIGGTAGHRKPQESDRSGLGNEQVSRFVAGNFLTVGEYFYSSPASSSMVRWSQNENFVVYNWRCTGPTYEIIIVLHGKIAGQPHSKMF